MVCYKSVFNVFFGCCLSASLMEIMISSKPNCANLVTFLQFFCITLHGLLKIKHKVFSPNIPLGQYFILISLFFVTSVANNYVYALHVASTLHMIIRSASSPASMLVAWYVKKQVPKVNAIIGSVIISSGVTIAMYGGAKVIEEETKFLYWCIGIVILLTTLITGAFTGLQQEKLYATYGKFPDEMLFYTHAIPLPLFLIIMPELSTIALSIPSYFWFIIALNIIAQFYCSHSVHILSTQESSVTVTFLLTIRKFVSLIISTAVFKNSLTIYHVIGTVLVIIGTYFYFSVGQQEPVRYKNK